MVRAAMTLPRTLAIAAVAVSLSTGANAASGDDGPFVLREGSFVCVSPDAYAEAERRLKTAPNRFKLGEQMTEEKLCIVIDDDDIEDMMAPFVLVTAEDADLIKVQFEIEYYKRIAYLNRTFARVIFTGWTHRDQLMLRADLGKEK